MINLLLDSSNINLSVGIMKDDCLLDSISYESWQTQSENMVPEIDKLLTKHNVSRNDISGVITAIGPGSYTGVRIALTISKTIALALDVPVYPVSSLRILKDNEKTSICLINARSGRSYFGVYKGSEIIIPDCIKQNEEVINFINEHKEYSICGDARYLGFANNNTNVCQQMVSLFKDLTPCNNHLGLKPIYMKD